MNEIISKTVHYVSTDVGESTRHNADNWTYSILEKLKKLGYKIDWDKWESKKWRWKKFRFVKIVENHPHRKIATRCGVDICIESMNSRDFQCWIDIRTDNENFVSALADLVMKYESL